MNPVPDARAAHKPQTLPLGTLAANPHTMFASFIYVEAPPEMLTTEVAALQYESLDVRVPDSTSGDVWGEW